jgi:hypothetical protein
MITGFLALMLTLRSPLRDYASFADETVSPRWGMISNSAGETRSLGAE